MQSRFQRPPAVVWALVLLGFLMSLSASLVLPTYLGYDEPQHVDMVVALDSGDGWPDPGERKLSQGVARSSNLYYGQRLKTRPLDVALEDLDPHGQRPTLDELGGDASAGGVPNQITQHPPLYYGVEALIAKVLGADDWSYDRFVELLRLITALLMAPLPLLVWAIANRLRAGPTTAVAAAALSLGVPGLTRVSGLVNNDGFLVITMTALLLGLTHVATGDLSRRTAIVVGALTGVTMLSKGFALICPLLVVLAYVIGKRGWRGLLRPLAVALGVGFLTGGFWWLRNLILYGALQPNGFGSALAQIEGRPRAADNPAVLSVFLDAVQDRIARTFWGGVGIASQPTVTKSGGTLLWVLVGVAVVIALVVGVRGRGERLALGLLLLPLPLVFAIIIKGSYGEYVEHAKLPGLQGRYLYLGISGLAVATAITLDRVLGRARAALPLLAVALVLVMQEVHTHRLVRNLWTSDDDGSLRRGLAGMRQVAPWPGAVTNLVLLATAVTAIATLVLSARGAFAPVKGERRADAAADR
jgi:4-amino-4-deoxy-L-arabinose transferase-like glycosyltransferase